MNKYTRDLEQQNDDLERAKRTTLASLEDFESKMNAAIERNAFLESELDEKEALKAVVQRMKDETRDLRSELRVVSNGGGRKNSLPNGEAAIVNGAASTSVASTPTSEKNNNSSSNGKIRNGLSPSKSSPSLAPTTRLSALNIVGDLLRKVGALELKLTSCKNIVKENTSSGSSGGRGEAAAGSSSGGKSPSTTSNSNSTLTSPTRI